MAEPMQKTGKLYVISGPSGAGKGTICKELAKIRDFYFSISMTTRAPRNGEENGREYWFVSKEEFEKTIAADGFLEYDYHYDHYYGTPKAKVEEALAAGRDVMLEIEMNGAANAKRVYPQAVLIFVLPPSLQELRRRIAGRGTETPEQIRLRMSKTVDEIRLLPQYDYYVINDDLQQATAIVNKIMDGGFTPIGERSADDDSIRRLIERYEQEEKTIC